MLTVSSIRTTLAAAAIVAAAVTVLPASPATAGRYGKAATDHTAAAQERGSKFTEKQCVKVGVHAGGESVCLSGTFVYRHGWVQTSARHWVTNCDQFESPNQAHVAYYAIYGARRGGNLVYGSRWVKTNFNLNNCSNTDSTNHRVSQPCMFTTIHGEAQLRLAGNRRYELNLMVGMNCSAPAGTVTREAR